MTTQSPAIRSQSRKSENWWKSLHKLFWIVTVCVIWQFFYLLFVIEKPRPGLLTLSAIFYELSDTYNLFSKAEMRQFGALGTDWLNSTRCRTCIRKSWTKFGIIGHSEALGPDLPFCEKISGPRASDYCIYQNEGLSPVITTNWSRGHPRSLDP